MYEEVSYFSEGLKIAAYLYRPKDWKGGGAPRAAISSLHGYRGMKDVYGLDVPRRLCEEGYFILARDHRLPIHVFDFAAKTSVTKICQGEDPGTFVGPDEAEVLE